MASWDHCDNENCDGIPIFRIIIRDMIEEKDGTITEQFPGFSYCGDHLEQAERHVRLFRKVYEEDEDRG